MSSNRWILEQFHPSEYEKFVKNLNDKDWDDYINGRYNAKFLRDEQKIPSLIFKVISVFFISASLINAIYWRNFLFLLAVNFVFFISIIPFTIWGNTNIYFFLLYFVLSLLALRIFKNFLAFFNTLVFYLIWLVLFNLHIG